MSQPLRDTADGPESNPKVLQQVADDEPVKLYVEHESGEILEALVKRSDSVNTLHRTLFISYPSVFGHIAYMSVRLSKSSTERFNDDTKINDILEHPDFPATGILFLKGRERTDFFVVFLSLAF
jgi:hypothetical protein